MMILPDTTTVQPNTSTPKILTIIVNWNKREMLDPLLASLPAQMNRFKFDVLVVDNASTDGSQEMIREKYPWVNLLTHEQNLGGTGGFNAGMRWGMESDRDYDYLWLLDNDVALQDNTLNGLVDAIETLPHTGCAGSTILVMGEEGQVQEAGCNINWPYGALVSQGIGNVRQLPPNAVWEIDYVAACSLLARTKAIREIGIWDPGYFLYWDDIDWGIRFNQSGWRVVATTASQMWHESFNNRRSGQGMSAFYLCVRNRLYALHKLHPNRWKMPMTLFRAVSVDLVFAANAQNAGYADKAKAVYRGIDDFLDMTMGKPPQELFCSVTPDINGQSGPSDEFVHNIRNIMVLTGENPEFTKKMCTMLHQKYPNAELRVMVYSGNLEPFQQAGIHNLEIRNLETFARRMLLHTEAAVKFDAVAASHFATHLLAERVAPRLIIVHEDLSFSEMRRSFVGIAHRLFSRPLIWLRAAKIVFCVLCTRSAPKINHHTFRPFDRPQTTLEPEFVWNHRKDRPSYGIPYRIVRAAVGVLCLPFILLWMLIPFLCLPLLRMLDKRNVNLDNALRNLTYVPNVKDSTKDSRDKK